MNQYLGGYVYDPVSVWDAPDELVEAIEALTEELPVLREMEQATEKAREEWRKGLKKR